MRVIFMSALDSPFQCFGLGFLQQLRLVPAITFAFLCVLMISPLNAQYEGVKWTITDGLPDNEIRGLSQTPDGYLWIATLNGLARFDGIRFKVFTKANSPGIASNRLTSLFQGRDGDLWAPYEVGGLLRFHRGTFRTYGLRDGINDSVVSTVMGDNMGQLWIVSRGHIQKWDEAHERFENVIPLNVRRYGPLVWSAGAEAHDDGKHVHSFVNGVLITYLLPRQLQKHRIQAMEVDKDNIAWVETTSGELYRLKSGDQRGGSQVLPSNNHLVYYGRAGQLWTVSVGADLKQLIEVSMGGARSTIAFTHAITDQQGNFWVGGVEGLYRIQLRLITVYTLEHGLLDRDVYPVYQDHSGSVWLGVWNKGLSRYNGGRFTNFTKADGLPGRRVTTLLEDNKGRLWIGTHGGVTTFHRGRFRPSPAPSFQEVVQAIYQDRSGVLWFGLRSGLARWIDGSQPEMLGAPGEYVDIHVIAQSVDGDLWFGGAMGLTQVHGDLVTHWTEENGLSSNNVWALYPESDGTLWIGTYDGGLLHFKDGKLTTFTKRDGLFSDGVYQILDDLHGYLWISCDMGIYRLSKEQLLSFARGTTTSISSLSFGTSDGLLSLRSNGGSMPAGIRSADGKLWFPTQDGVAVLDPSQTPTTPDAPQVIIESALLDHVPTPTDAMVRVPPSTDSLELHYTAPSFYKPEQIRFRYRMEGLDRDWVESGHRRTAFYSHIPPGSYTFKVAAANAGGTWGPETSSPSISVLAPFYQTLWFKTFIVFAIAIIIMLTWRRRLAQLRVAQAQQLQFLQQLIASQEGERKRIAAELHDGLGQRLVVINAIAHMSLRSRNDRLESLEAAAFEEIREEAQAAIQDTHTISYDLRPVHLDRFGLTKSIDILIKDVSFASGVPIRSQLDNIDDLLPDRQKINLYRIVQEALTNMVKYASASAAEVQIGRHDTGTTLVISDNGIGFEIEGNLNSQGESGLGLRGMSERATLVGGSLTVVSSVGNGTVLTLQLPKVPA